YLGGAGLARGYLGRPDWTAGRFVPHPFSTEPGARLYRTGDRVRRNRAGEVEFLGRVDHQVKLRGFRIELGEIEALLRGRPEVRDAVAVVREDGGSGRLVVYVVGRPRHEPGVAALLGFLREKLPEYMVPSALVVLPALPLTANGKVDRRALPEPERVQATRGARVAPRNETEERLAEIWAAVLSAGPVGIEDNFFELGGDSILAIQVIARANRVGIRLNPHQLFEHQTIARLAAVAGTSAEAVAEQGAVTGDVRLTPIQRWFFEQGFVDPEHWNQSVWLELEEPPPPLHHLEHAFQALFAHHDSLRSRFVPRPDGWRQRIAGPEEASPSAVLSRLDLSGSADPAAALEAAAARAQASLDLARGPLVRTVLFDLGAGRPSRLLIASHHLVVDGVSWRVLLEDLRTALEQLRRGEAVELPPKTTSFQRWAERLDAHAQSPALEQEMAWWLSVMPERPPELPVDGTHDRPAVATQRRHMTALGVEETRALLQEVPAAYRTQINDVLLTALARGFARWSGGRSLYASIEGHGRETLFEDVDLSRTVGWFTSRYPVLLDAGDAARPGEALKAVKEQLRRMPARGLGYLLLRYLTRGAAAETLRSRPEPEVKVNYLGQIDVRAGGGGLFRQVGDSQGAERSPRSHLSWLLSLDGGVAEGRLFLRWTYSGDTWRDESIEALARAVLEALQEIIAHCLAAEAGGCTASDFPLSGLDEERLAALLASVPAPAGIEGRARHRAIEDLYAASPLQKSLLFHTLASPGSTVGFEQKSSALRGDLDPELFRRTWQLALDRHPILRTSFVSDGLEEPVQVVWRRLELPFDLQDWRGLPEAEQRSRLEDYLRADRRRGFDPAVAPLLRLALIRLEDDLTQLVWSYHHLLIDAWCRNLLQQEVFAIYDALRRGTEPPFPTTLPYRGYIAWLQSQDVDRAREFWRRELAGYCPRPARADRPARGPRREESYGQRSLQLTQEESERLQAFARREKVTLGTLLHAAWGFVLGRHLTAGDVVFGSTVSGRPPELAGVESILGMFINNLPVRVRIPSGSPVSAWLAELQSRLTEMRLLEWTAPGQIQEWGELPAGQRLFDSLVIFQNYPVEEAQQRDASGGLEILSFRSRMETGYPLTVVAGPLQPLFLRMLFDTRWYDEATVERLLGRLRTALLEMAGEGDRPLSEIPLLTPEERRELLVGWNGAPEPDAAPLHLRALDHARSSPGRPALVAGEESLTWGDLARRAGQLAGALVRAGARPGDRVAVQAGATPDLAVALLGALSAGAVFLALDPAAPAERAGDLLEELDVDTLVSGGAPEPWMPARTILLGTEDGEPVVREVSGDQPACLLAGAGGGAVELSHAGLARAAAALERLCPLGEEDTVLVLPSQLWERCAVDLLAALALGARVVLAGREEAEDGGLLARRLAESGATLLQAPPAVWISLLTSGWAGDPRLVAMVRDGALSRGLARELLPRTAALFTVHGSPETAGWSAAGRVEPFPEGMEGPLGVGRPAAGVRLYLLNEDLQPVPAGRPGWIFAAGPMAQGSSPGLTEQRLVPDRLADAPGSPLFFTGDLGRLLPDGRLEILARPGSLGPVSAAYGPEVEVESALHGHPELLDGAVSAWEDEAGERHRVAHVVPRHPVFPTVTEVSGYLKTRLPREIVPALFVRSARIDRQALSSLNEGARAVAPFVPPCNPRELRLKQIWEDLFGFRPIGIKDDFFELGGHSLLVIRLMAQIREEFGRDLHLAELLKASTIEDLARALEEQDTARSWSPLVAIQPRGTRPPLFCIHALGGEVLCYVDLARYLGSDQPVYGLQARAWSGLDLEDPESIEAMAAEYVAALRAAQPAGPYQILGYSLGGVVALEMVRQLQEQGEEVRILAILDTLLTGEGGTKWDIPEILSGLALGHPCVSVDHLRRLEGDLEAQLAYFVETTTEAGIIPGLDLKMARCWARACIAHRKIRKLYEPAPIAGRITLLRALQGQILHSADPTLGWGKLAGEGLEIVEVPGNHDTVIQLPHVQTLARKLRERLDPPS
ncbi:MAG TPA: condensation domain-containing protein, partial [Thermoanaerobaculia bacterium]